MISRIGLLVHWQKLSYMITLEYMSTIYKGVRGRICRNIITPDRKLHPSFGRCERSRGWHRNGSQKKSVPESQIFPVWRAGDIIRVWTFWKKLQEDLAGDWGKSHVRRKMQKAWRWNLEIIRITTWNCAVPPIPEWVHIRRRHCLNSTFHLQRTVKDSFFKREIYQGADTLWVITINPRRYGQARRVIDGMDRAYREHLVLSNY